METNKTISSIISTLLGVIIGGSITIIGQIYINHQEFKFRLQEMNLVKKDNLQTEIGKLIYLRQFDAYGQLQSLLYLSGSGRTNEEKLEAFLKLSNKVVELSFLFPDYLRADYNEYLVCLKKNSFESHLCLDVYNRIRNDGQEFFMLNKFNRQK